MAYKKKELNVELSEEQKAFIDENWHQMRMPELVKGTFNDDKLDGRSIESKAVANYLGDREPLPTAYKKIGNIELTEDQKDFIISNLGNGSSATEIARILFNNNRLGPLNLESRTVYNFIKELPVELKGEHSNDEVLEEYKPINTLKQLIDKVNACLFKDYQVELLNAQQKKHFESVRGFLRAPRFLQMVNSYSSRISRDIFESEFIRTVYDKPDLTPDELNLCINLCSNYVLMITVNRHLDMLNEKYERMFDDPEGKVSQALAEMIKAKTEELNKCDTRQQKLIDDLQGKRSERHKNKQKSTLSVVDLIEWWSDEKERKKTVEREELRKTEVATELDRLENIQDVKCRILGFSREEILHG